MKILPLTTILNESIGINDELIVKAEIIDEINVDITYFEDTTSVLRKERVTLSSFSPAIIGSLIIEIVIISGDTIYLNSNRIIRTETYDNVSKVVFRDVDITREYYTSSTVVAINALIQASITTEKAMVFLLSEEGVDAATTSITFRMPSGFFINEFQGLLTVAATGASLFTVDVKKNGSTILDDPITFDASATTIVGAATPYSFLSDAARTFSKGDTITVEVTQVGSTTSGQGASINVIGYIV